jgi:uncharacterized protein (DUF1800 family)
MEAFAQTLTLLTRRAIQLPAKVCIGTGGRNAQGAIMVAADRNLQGAIAATRFGLGARPGEIAEAARDPQGYLKAQIRRDGADLPENDGEASADRLAALRAYRQQRAAAKAREGESAPDADPARMARRLLRNDAGDDALARLRLACGTPDGFRERWALFWANHFTVAASKLQVAALAGPFEAEAIRPNAFGRFADLLTAAETHPAMLLYLDQVQSVGPGSPAAQRAALRSARGGARRGLNENLAREILELHTVGVDAGYTQADVTEFARALTGLTVGMGGAGAPGPTFRPAAHEPGPRTVMGVRYAPAARGQAQAILADLAAKPQTARFVCGKIARHFVADAPPPALTARLEAAWTASDGDLARVAEALVDAPEAWAAEPSKFKTPYEFVVSSYRAAGEIPSAQRDAAVLTALGQRTFGAPSPKGWPDEAAPWAAADALVKRMQFAQAFGGRAGPRVSDPNRMAADALGARLGQRTATAVRRAESRPEAVALLLMSPEFQRR